MIAELARAGAHVDEWLFCPYHPEGSVEAFARSSADRKPAPGMALAAAEALDIDLSVSWVVGDSDADVGLARAVGARPLRVGVPAGSAVHEPDVPAFPDLAAAVTHILAVEASPNSPSQGSGTGFPGPSLRRRGCLRHRVQRRAARRFADGRPVPVPRRSRAAERRARPGRDRVLMRQRRFRIDREPPPVRPREVRRAGH